jgi:DNA repair photolyase
MALYYSAARHAFLDDAIHTTLPEDAVPVARARHRALMEAQATGAAIVAGEDGAPRIDRPRATRSIQRAAAIRQVKREAARRIEAIAPIWRQLNDARVPSEAGAARFAAINAVRVASDAIEAEIATMTLAALKALDIASHRAWPEASA